MENKCNCLVIVGQIEFNPGGATVMHIDKIQTFPTNEDAEAWGNAVVTAGKHDAYLVPGTYTEHIDFSAQCFQPEAEQPISIFDIELTKAQKESFAIGMKWLEDNEPYTYMDTVLQEHLYGDKEGILDKVDAHMDEETNLYYIGTEAVHPFVILFLDWCTDQMNKAKCSYFRIIEI